MTLADLADLEMNMDPEHEWKRKCAEFVTERCPRPDVNEFGRWWEGYEEWLRILEDTEEWRGVPSGDARMYARWVTTSGALRFATLDRAGREVGTHPGKGREGWSHYVLAITAAVIADRADPATPEGKR
mgnify:FL=1